MAANTGSQVGKIRENIKNVDCASHISYEGRPDLSYCNAKEIHFQLRSD